MKKNISKAILCSMFFWISCQNETEVQVNELTPIQDEFEYSDLRFDPITLEIGNQPKSRVQSEHKIVLYSATYYTDPKSNEMGRTVIFSDRGNKHLEFDFSPFAKLNGTPDISFYIDGFRPSADLNVVEYEQALVNASTTWENVSCSDFGLYREPQLPFPTGITAQLLGFGPSFTGYVADINQAGFLPGEFFNLLIVNGANTVLAATVTFLLIDTTTGEFIDTNNDGKLDVALREIYYNDNFPWSTDGFDFDLESIALHEMGHGLSQEHFGKGFIKSNGGIQFAPRAVMNAAYTGVQRNLSGTDQGGHCSLWGNWPNK